MAIHTDWVIACQTALVDRLSGKVSLIGVLETLQMPRFPCELPPFYVVALWHNATDMVSAAQLRIEVEEYGEPNSAVLSEEHIEFQGHVGHRTICLVPALTVSRPGRYRIVAKQLGPDGDVCQQRTHTLIVTAVHHGRGQAQA